MRIRILTTLYALAMALLAPTAFAEDRDNCADRPFPAVCDLRVDGVKAFYDTKYAMVVNKSYNTNVGLFYRDDARVSSVQIGAPAGICEGYAKYFRSLAEWETEAAAWPDITFTDVAYVTRDFVVTATSVTVTSDITMRFDYGGAGDVHTFTHDVVVPTAAGRRILSAVQTASFVYDPPQ